MAMPRKGSRAIEVDGRGYRWRIRKKPTYMQAAHRAPMTLAVQAQDEGASGVLVVDLMMSRPDNWIRPHTTSVAPSIVRDVIREAIADGWAPLNGSTYRLKYGRVIQERAL